MRIKRELVTSLLLGLFTVQHICAQKPAGRSPATVVPSATSEATKNNEEAGRAESVQEIRSLADRVLRFQNRELRIKTTILLADVLWDKGKDEAFARKLFLKADELIRAEVAANRERNSTSAGNDQADAPLSAPVARRLKRLLVQKLARHDSILSQSLGDQDKLSPENAVEQLTLSEKLNSARDFIQKNNYSSATRYIEKSIEDNPKGRELNSLLSLLSDLRTKDRLAADKLFVMAITQMSLLPAVQTNDILVIGNYLFASSRLDPKLLSQPQVFISPAWVNGILLQADVSVARPGISAPTARAYLSAATHMLLRPSDDADENLRKFAATRLLIPHAQVFAPEVVKQLSAVQPGSKISATGSEAGDAAAPDEKNGKLDLETLISRIDRMPAGNARNLYILQTFRALFIKGDHIAAARIASKIEDQTARAQLTGLIKFRQAATAIEAGQYEIAEQNLNSLDSALQRGLLKLGLAQLLLKKGDRAGAEAALNSALTGLRANDSNPQPHLMLAAVELLATVDIAAATQAFREAVQAFNSLEASSGPSASKFSETVKVGDSSVTFPLEVVGVKSGTLTSTLKSLNGDREAVKTTILNLKDESTLSESILAFATVLLG